MPRTVTRTRKGRARLLYIRTTVTFARPTPEKASVAVTARSASEIEASMAKALLKKGEPIRAPLLILATAYR